MSSSSSDTPLHRTGLRDIFNGRYDPLTGETDNKQNDKTETKSNHGTNDPVEGVGPDDLPIVPNMVNKSTKDFVDLPVVRILDWRTDKNGNPNRKELKDPTSITAAFQQTRGREARDQCDSCVKGTGPWKSCIVSSGGRDASVACANCRFSRLAHTCTHRLGYQADELLEQFENFRRPAKRPQSKAPSVAPNNPFPFIGPNDPAWYSDAEDENSEEPPETPAAKKRKPSTQPRQSKLIANKGKDSNSDSTGITFSAESPAPNGWSTKRQASNNRKATAAQASSSKSTEHRSSKFDGKVIPFPLGPDAIDNLPMLKQAIEDLDLHSSVIKRRIEQLQKPEEINPWDLV